MQAAIIHLEVILEVLQNNLPINRAEGNHEQAQLEEDSIAEIEQALSLLRVVESWAICPTLDDVPINVINVINVAEFAEDDHLS